ncbi:hypothetical protein JCM11491_003046 [Sporobolomyces phaffii]
MNLLPAVPSHLPFSKPSSSPPASLSNAAPSKSHAEDERGFSDLASDHEEELTVEEREELEKKRKRRRLERGREERIRLLEEQEASRAGHHRQTSEDLETEPSETQLSMMKRLHSTLSTAQNPSLLEMRILTNHSSDPKFQFLKKGGRWREIWERIRRGEDVASAENSVPTSQGGTSVGGLVGLGDYGSSDEEQVDETTDPATATEEQRENGESRSEPGGTVAEFEAGAANDRDEEEERKKKEAKAEKVREWARRRKEAREGAGASLDP